MLSRNEYLTASDRVNFRPLKPVMVTPDLDTPGIKATAWATPTNRASYHFI
jgi:hypothetical protein